MKTLRVLASVIIVLAIGYNIIDLSAAPHYIMLEFQKSYQKKEAGKEVNYNDPFMDPVAKMPLMWVAQAKIAGFESRGYSLRHIILLAALLLAIWGVTMKTLRLLATPIIVLAIAYGISNYNADRYYSDKAYEQFDGIFRKTQMQGGWGTWERRQFADDADVVEARTSELWFIVLLVALLLVMWAVPLVNANRTAQKNRAKGHASENISTLPTHPGIGQTDHSQAPPP